MPSMALERRRAVTRSQRHKVTRGPATNGRSPSPEPRAPSPVAGAPGALLKRVAKSHNLTEDNWRRIVKALGRLPTLTEVGIFGVMYRAHCS